MSLKQNSTRPFAHNDVHMCSKVHNLIASGKSKPTATFQFFNQSEQIIGRDNLYNVRLP